MKVYVYKTSDYMIDNGVIREFQSLDECITTLQKETSEPEYVVSDMKQYYGSKNLSDCTWMVEIYDYYRE